MPNDTDRDLTGRTPAQVSKLLEMDNEDTVLSFEPIDEDEEFHEI